MSNQAVVITGNPIDGIVLHGPFPNVDAAVIEYDGYSEEYWIAKLKPVDPAGSVPKPLYRYERGTRFWVMIDNKPAQVAVRNINIRIREDGDISVNYEFTQMSSGQWYGSCDEESVSQFHTTKEALLASL